MCWYRYVSHFKVADEPTIEHSLLAYIQGFQPFHFCGIMQISKADFRITILNFKIPENNDFHTIPGKISGVTPATPILIITGRKIKYRLVCVLFIGKT